jgi:hypothetical protein
MWEGPENPSKFMKDGSLCMERRGKVRKATELTDPIVQAFQSTHVPERAETNESQKKFVPTIQLTPLVSKPIDSLMLCSTWTPSEISTSPIKCQIEGLMLQGCRFDGTRLTELTSDDPTFIPVPMCHIAWMPNV